MALWDKLRGEFIDIIEWTDQTGGTLVHRFDRYGHEIKMGAKLVVRPGQRAVFVNEGRIADTFEPGTYSLETKNLPILATLQGWKYGFESPFKAEVYFIDATERLDRKWGTPSPVMMRDRDFGVVRLRARGNCSYRVGLTGDMISRFVGARADFTMEAVEGQVRTQIVSALADTLGESKIAALDLLAQYDELGAAMKAKVSAVFAGVGLDLLSFTIETISVPDEVQQAIDQRSSMGAIGDLNRFSQFQAANALRDAAQNEGGTAAGLMGMMVGGQLGGSIGGVLKQEPSAAVGGTPCPACRAANGPGAKFCGACGASLAGPAAACAKCGQPLPAGSKFCGHCGAPQAARCAKCGRDLEPAARFCGECGTAVAP